MLFKTKNKTSKAFTLAEILITLSIIGVVAALTIPTLIQRIGDEEIVSKLNKAYSTLSQATESIITEQGNPKVWNTSVGALYNAYKDKLRISKDCGSEAGCFRQLGLKGYTYLNNTASGVYINSSGSVKKLILSDGIQTAFYFDENNCSTTVNGSEGVCARILVDLNGIKKPNKIGRDAFIFVLKETGLYPAGCDSDRCNLSNDTGVGCACKVLQEGKIDY